MGDLLRVALAVCVFNILAKGRWTGVLITSAAALAVITAAKWGLSRTENSSYAANDLWTVVLIVWACLVWGGCILLRRLFSTLHSRIGRGSRRIAISQFVQTYRWIYRLFVLVLSHIIGSYYL
jgi:hypothetical protein